MGVVTFRKKFKNMMQIRGGSHNLDEIQKSPKNDANYRGVVAIRKKKSKISQK